MAPPDEIIIEPLGNLKDLNPHDTLKMWGIGDE